jgi:uncharacterized protein YacL
MFLWLVRGIFLAILAGTAAHITQLYGEYTVASQPHGTEVHWVLVFSGIMGCGLLAIVFDILYPRKSISTISAVYFGLLIGSLLSHLLGLAFGPALDVWGGGVLGVPFSLATTTILCYICVSVLLQTKSDFRFIIPYVEFSRQLKGIRPLILDTNVIIDGRIADIADTGMLDQTLVVPRFVLEELQVISDSSEKFRRNRGRRGLDVISRLQKCPHVDVEMMDGDHESTTKMDVDSRLIAMALRLNGKLVTNDLGLTKAAKIQNVPAISINEIGNAARPPVLWGDSLTVRLVKAGEEPGQGIGYLDDGTMVVAEMGRNFVGQEVNLTVTSVLQTNAGRMVFGRIEGKQPDPRKVPVARN